MHSPFAYFTNSSDVYPSIKINVMRQEIHVFEDKAELADYFGEILAETTADGATKYIAISGGKTPETIFDHIAVKFAKSVKWNNIKIFWVDERCVAPNDTESNYKMAKEHLLDKVAIPEANIFRVKGELSPNTALADYIEILSKDVPQKDGWPLFDLIVLGMGDDGHTASIFPHQINLWKAPESCAIGNHPVSGQPRVTLTGKSINNAKQIVMLITGKNKAEKFEQIVSYDQNSAKYPAKMIDRSKTIWLLDEDAASLL